jgi:hypothetical protein
MSAYMSLVIDLVCQGLTLEQAELQAKKNIEG